jgi:isopentenyldiphosphate isomerase
MTEEIFDIVDENGNPTGETVSRTKAHEEGIRHRTAHIWVVRYERGRAEVLLQKRALNKESFPGRYDTSSAGHIHAGDEPIDSALRELSEELGINADEDELEFVGTFPIQYEKEFHGKMFKDNEIAFVYIYEEDVDIEELSIQKEELDSVEWFDLKKLYKDCQPPRDEKFCVPMGGLELVRKYIYENLRERSDYAAKGMWWGMLTGMAIGAVIGVTQGRIGSYMVNGMIFGMILGQAVAIARINRKTE